MAVLFPAPRVGFVLNPGQPSELLQGFLNIMTAENSQNGQLTQSQLASYGKKVFVAVDTNASVFGYLNQNFSRIAGLDGNPNGISADDLVQLRNGIPTPPPVFQPQPPPVQPPPVLPPTTPQNPLYGLVLGLMQQMLLMLLTSLRGGFR